MRFAKAYRSVAVRLRYHLERLGLLSGGYPRIVVQRAILPHGISFEVANLTEYNRVFDMDEEENCLRFLLDRLSPEDVFFDVGACIGVFTLHAACKCRRVLAFEPDEGFRQHLYRNIALNKVTNVEVIPWAVSDRSATVPLFTDGVAGKSPSLSNSGFGGQVLIETHALDDEVARGGLPLPDVIKMDIEGAEILALRGMRKLLTSFPPRYIYVEIHPQALSGFSSSKQEVMEIFDAAGYRVALHLPRGLEEHYVFSAAPH